MARIRYTREFKLEAVRLIRDQSLGMRQATQDVDIHEIAEIILASGVVSYPEKLQLDH